MTIGSCIDLRRVRWLTALVCVLVGVAATTTASAATFTYDAPAIARVGVHASAISEAVEHSISDSQEESASLAVEARGTSTTPLATRNATEAVDDLAGAVSRPAGVADDFVSEVANNGKGTVWRAPGTTGNGGTVRIMEPTAQYPNGYVRFYNEGGQPLSLNGKPGPNSATHIPINPDGTYPLPKGWGGAG